jgi:hypothetical protein
MTRKNNTASGKLFIIRALGMFFPSVCRSDKMSKTNSPFANDAKQVTSTAPQISNTPIVTGTGSMYWNVRDIVFGPNRTTPDDHANRTSEPQKHK